ncbi:D-alanyl-D-alanine-carboxypeptidase/D-alanyl-D-alanine-endopeptidase [Streptomyces sp. V4I23]|uniref:serine hydrolase domain-containing protein n=1 Tax=Streptomyces sp. V4I23 TaxID=3042282 RepID=UPI002782F7CA|nr:serine hydrolase domain-containing protein [Streptomyces sp. V4I23]MDQ1009474.1 D-alanyl-D-alanine-carboxypeptidase/D-alanyl-D-alanine-endopeptidase [Streptomyces sp. V4I23]
MRRLLRPAPVCAITGTGPVRAEHGHDPDAYVEIGSLTKALTGTLLARLADAGRLDPDDRLTAWLPAVPAGSEITLRQLADHTSGLPRLHPLPTSTDPRDPYATLDAEEFDRVLRRLDAIAVRKPGAGEEYSNLGYAVLGAALEAAGGGTYEELLRAHVLTPLGVDDVTARPPADRTLTARGLFGRPRTPWTMTGPILPAGGLWATPRAVARLVQGLLVDGALGEPAVSWQSAGELRWHNGATRDASVFAGAFPGTTTWAVVHRLGGRPAGTDRAGLKLLAEAKKAPQGRGTPERPAGG